MTITQPAADKKYSLLIVDDEEAILKSLNRLFQDTYQVYTAKSGDAALQLFESNPVNLIVADFKMPGMDGLELLHTVKQRWPETIRVMLTGHADVQSVLDDISNGVIFRFFSKPWNDNELQLGVQLALRQYEMIQQIKKMKQASGAVDGPGDEFLMAAERRGCGGGNRYTLLFVDDEEYILRTLERVFSDGEYQVLTAVDGEAALKVLEQESVQLIVSDFHMPGLDGLALLRRVKERWPETIRVMLTGFADVNSLMDEISDGIIYKFIAKPWQNEDLIMSVRLALRQYALIKEMKKLSDS